MYLHLRGCPASGARAADSDVVDVHCDSRQSSDHISHETAVVNANRYPTFSFIIIIQVHGTKGNTYNSTT